MLFQSTEFIGWFLPATVAIFFILGRLPRAWPVGWLVTASLFFYSWWIPEHLPILIASVFGNYALARVIFARSSRTLLAVGVIGNLALLGYFKYAWFIAENAALLAGTESSWARVVLPLGISFFTFQQIAFLADCHARLIVRMPPLLDYALFVTFFPQLIAGPIVHHNEMMGQFERRETFRPRISNVSIGLTVFAIGLVKKVVIADSLAVPADAAFDSAAQGVPIQVLTAWVGAIAFTLQIYFDFSGYSDMAIGLARIFGIDLPLNFDSPLKARNIIDFWRRWHISLTRFFNGYLFNPIVLHLTRRRAAMGHRPNQKTPGNFFVLLAFPTLLTMFFIGVWHGAGFQFVVFGLLHGLYLVVNHAFKAFRSNKKEPRRAGVAASVALTFLAVSFSMVFFRSETMSQALLVTRGLFGFNGLALPNVTAGFLANLGIAGGSWLTFGTSLIRVPEMLWALSPLVIIWGLPNTQEWMRGVGIGVNATAGLPTSRLPAWVDPWKPDFARAALLALLLCVALSRIVSSAPSRFLYFNF